MPKYRAFKDSWSVNSFCKRYKRGEINFDNPIQRGVVWTRRDSSLYIHSLLYDILIYQKPFLISKKENGWDVLDGKQRGTTLIKYIDNEFPLMDIQNEPPITLNGEEISLNKRYFKYLPEELQMRILDFQIEIAMLEEAPVEIEALFFERSNSGKAMAKIDLARSRNRSIETVKEIAAHPIFNAMFSSSALKKLPQDEIIVKTWQSLNETEPDFSAKHFNSLMSELEITENDKQQIASIYDTILAAYKVVLIQDSDVASLMMKKTHMLSYISFVELFSDHKQLSEWILEFYSDMPDEYFDASNKQTTSLRNISKRMRIVKESIDKFLENG